MFNPYFELRIEPHWVLCRRWNVLVDYSFSYGFVFFSWSVLIKKQFERIKIKYLNFDRSNSAADAVWMFSQSDVFYNINNSIAIALKSSSFIQSFIQDKLLQNSVTMKIRVSVTKYSFKNQLFLLSTSIRKQILDISQWSATTVLFTAWVWRVGLTVGDVSQVSQGDATEKLAHQVPTQTAAAHRRLEEASGHTHAQEKDETHESSKGHVSGKYGYCCSQSDLSNSAWAHTIFLWNELSSHLHFIVTLVVLCIMEL